MPPLLKTNLSFLLGLGFNHSSCAAKGIGPYLLMASLFVCLIWLTSSIWSQLSPLIVMYTFKCHPKTLNPCLPLFGSFISSCNFHFQSGSQSWSKWKITRTSQNHKMVFSWVPLLCEFCDKKFMNTAVIR